MSETIAAIPPSTSASARTTAAAMAQRATRQRAMFAWSGLAWRLVGVAMAAGVMLVAAGAGAEALWVCVIVGLLASLMLAWRRRESSRVFPWQTLAFLDRRGGYRGRLMLAAARQQTLPLSPAAASLEYPSPLTGRYWWRAVASLVLLGVVSASPWWAATSRATPSTAKHTMALQRAELLSQELKHYAEQKDLQRLGEELVERLARTDEGLRAQDFEALARFEEQAADALEEKSRTLARLAEELTALQKDLSASLESIEGSEELRAQLADLRQALSRTPYENRRLNDLIARLENTARPPAAQPGSGEEGNTAQAAAAAAVRQQEVQRAIDELRRQVSGMRRHQMGSGRPGSGGAGNRPGRPGKGKGKGRGQVGGPGHGSATQGGGVAPLRFTNDSRVADAEFSSAEIPLKQGQTILIGATLSKRDERAGAGSTHEHALQIGGATETVQWQTLRQPSHRQAIKKYFGDH